MTYPTVMRSIVCTEHYVDDNHCVLCLLRGKLWECYVMQHDETGETPYMYMYSVPADEWISKGKKYKDFYDSAIKSAPQYYDLFEE